MSRPELLRLIRDAEHQHDLRRKLHRCSSWEELGTTARQQGYAIRAEELCIAQRQSRAAGFLREARLSPIARLS
jgi:hypothetical protein